MKYLLCLVCLYFNISDTFFGNKQWFDDFWVEDGQEYSKRSNITTAAYDTLHWQFSIIQLIITRLYCLVVIQLFH